jgi:septal ring factor EnvC (AmiA/AmiB activator)
MIAVTVIVCVTVLLVAALVGALVFREQQFRQQSHQDAKVVNTQITLEAQSQEFAQIRQELAQTQAQLLQFRGDFEAFKMTLGFKGTR